MQNFDFSDPDMTNSKRTTTIVPQQALFLMNSSMSVDVARSICEQPAVANARDALNRIIAIYAIVFQRQPRPAEINIAYQFIGQEQKSEADLDKDLKEAMEKAAKAKQDQLTKRATDKGDGRDMFRAIRNEGDIVERKLLTPWETYTQALLLSNEAAYVN
jgi:undecaprenyl pyrophosphate synthase